MATIFIKQIRSRIGCPKDQKRTLDALGLKKINRVVKQESTPSILGMVKKVKHLVTVYYDDFTTQSIVSSISDKQSVTISVNDNAIVDIQDTESIDNCLICHSNKATKTNSHLIPSFLVAQVASYDSSYKRGKEVLVKITPNKRSIYVGELPDTKLEELFDTENMSDERINEELKQNPVSEDYVFCPSCEKKLSYYLESPYSTYLQNNASNISTEIHVFFWISVVWRMSILNKYGFKLPELIEKRLNDSLNVFFEQKDKKKILPCFPTMLLSIIE
jgi:large subunit ribosomal protein L30